MALCELELRAKRVIVTALKPVTQFENFHMESNTALTSGIQT